MLKRILKWIFLISLLYYLYWIGLGIYYSIAGISSQYAGIHIESLCNHQHITYYGFDGFLSAIENGIIYTLFMFWYIPLFQVIYIVGYIIRKIVNKYKSRSNDLV